MKVEVGLLRRPGPLLVEAAAAVLKERKTAGLTHSQRGMA
jgi:hypothetical protein